jgi:hypothetical protein
MAIYMIFIDFMKLAYSVQNSPGVLNASQGESKHLVCASKEVGCQQLVQ